MCPLEGFIGQTGGGNHKMCPLEGLYRTNGRRKSQNVSIRGSLSDKQRTVITKTVRWGEYISPFVLKGSKKTMHPHGFCLRM